MGRQVKLNRFFLQPHFVILALTLLAQTSTRSQQWTLQQTTTAAGLFAVDFVDSLHGWAVGDSGIILRTSDAGNSWITQNSDTNFILWSVCFVDTLSGWSVGRRRGGAGIVLCTRDGGNTWIDRTPIPRPSFWDVHFSDLLHGWIVGGTQTPSGVFGAIYKTIDGGTTWLETVDNSAGGFQGVFFRDSLEGWVVGGKSLFDNFSHNLILHTTNGDNSWHEQTAQVANGPLYRVKFTDRNTGWTGGFQHIFKTSNGGSTWQSVAIEQTGAGVLDIHVVDSNAVWIVRANDVQFTSDGGISWINQTPDSSSDRIYVGVDFVDRDNGWLVGGKGSIWKYASGTTRVNEKQERQASNRPQYIFLAQNYPNPFNSYTTISFINMMDSYVVLTVRDALGKEIKVLFAGWLDAGSHRVNFDAMGYASGVYFYCLSALNREGLYQVETRVMTLIK